MSVHPFRAAVEARDAAAMEALLADDVVFTSPVAFKPYPGKPITAAIRSAASRMLARWFSAGIGCPRCSSALPPSATTILMRATTPGRL